jgi:hypothetical protein
MNCCFAIYVSHYSGSRDPEVTRQELLRIHELGRNANLATMDSLGMLVIHTRLPFTNQPFTTSQKRKIYIIMQTFCHLTKNVFFSFAFYCLHKKAIFLCNFLIRIQTYM